ncbi:MAG: hypothetical protein ACKVOO_03440 [Burkholderiaceae bacterium]
MNRTIAALAIATFAALASANSFAADDKVALSSQGTQVATPVATQGAKAEQAGRTDAPAPSSAFDPQINVRIGNSYPLISI